MYKQERCLLRGDLKPAASGFTGTYEDPTEPSHVTLNTHIEGSQPVEAIHLHIPVFQQYIQIQRFFMGKNVVENFSKFFSYEVS